MKQVSIIAVTVAALLICSCRVEYSKNSDAFYTNQWDEMNIPDSHNCGADENTDFKVLTETGLIADGVTLLLRTDTNQYSLSSYKTDLPKTLTVRDFDFSSHNFVAQNMQRYTEAKTITFINCKFKGFRNDAGSPDNAGKAYFIFDHCSFSGNVSSSYITLKNCKIGGFTSDAINPLREYYAENLYIYDLAHEPKDGELHLDGIQIYGDQASRNNVVDDKWVSKVETGEIHFNNVRFEIPSINLGPDNKAYVNACVMFQLEFSGVDNVSFRNLYVNGGGKWYPLYMDYGKNNERSEDGVSWSHKNLVMENAMVSNNFGNIFYPQLLSDATIINVDHHSNMFVTSIWKDEFGIAHILVSNDSSLDKTLTIKSDRGTFQYQIPHCPSNWALGGQIDTKVNKNESLIDASGKPYTEYKFEDLPFDLEFTVPKNPTFILCYDGDEQIRYVSLDGKTHYRSQLKNNIHNHLPESLPESQ